MRAYYNNAMPDKEPSTVDKYIAGFPDEVQAVLQKMRSTISPLVPGATEVISYGVPTFKINGKYVVYFAGYKSHVSIYPIPHTASQALQDAFAPYVHGRGTLRFALDKPIPYDLIEKVTLALLREHQDRTTR